METNNLFEALYNYYNSNKGKMPTLGLSNGVRIDHVVVISKDGKYIRYVADNAELDKDGKVVMVNKKPVSKRYDNVPFDVQVTSGVKAHLLYGNFEYFFPTVEGKRAGTECNDAFVGEIKQALDDSNGDKSLDAIVKFYENGEYATIAQSLLDEAQKQKDKELAGAKTESARKKIDEKPLSKYIDGNFSFQIHGEQGLVIEDSSLHDVFFKYYERQQSDNFSGYGMDCITGEYGRLISVFPSKSMQATLIGFNTDASNSHGYEQMGNCPMKLDTAMKISSAFDYLRYDRKHSIKVGNADEMQSLIFWSSSNNEKEVSSEEIESDFFNEISKLTGFAVKVEKKDGEESTLAENENSDKVRSIFKGSKTYEKEKNSTYYVMNISCPSKGTIYVSDFRSGKIGELYDNLEKYQHDFSVFKEKFVSPYKALEACYKRKSDGKAVNGEQDSKNHIKMRRNLLFSAIFGGKYEEQVFAEIIDRIYREGSLEYKYFGGVNRSDRIACMKAYASQSHKLDDFRFEENLDSLPYQTGAFYGVCEAIHRKYEIATGKKQEGVWKIYNDEFKKGLANQTNEFIVEKLKRHAIVLSKYIKDENEKEYLVGNYEKEQVWTCETKPNGVIRRHGEWKITHDDDKDKWGELDWAIWRMKKLAGQTKSCWTTDDKAMYLLGFKRMFDKLTYSKKEA